MRNHLSILACSVFALTVSAQREIKPEEGYTPQVGVIVSMLNDMKNRVEYTVKDLNIEEI